MSRHHVEAARGRRWERARRAALERDGWRCGTCGGAGRLEVHHVRALSAGGAAFELANLETMCRGCHIEHHRPAVPPERAAWLTFIQELVGPLHSSKRAKALTWSSGGR